MNKDRILTLADVIEAQPHTTADHEEGFAMDAYHHGCGTPSCIAGWAAFMAKGPENIEEFFIGAGGYEICDVAGKYLGISLGTQDSLFVPIGWFNNEITPSQAASTLRNLAETGKVKWDI